MLYVLPPPRAPDPPSPWDSIICGNSNSSNNNQERSTWSTTTTTTSSSSSSNNKNNNNNTTTNKTHPPKIRLREFQIFKKEVRKKFSWLNCNFFDDDAVAVVVS